MRAREDTPVSIEMIETWDLLRSESLSCTAFCFCSRFLSWANSGKLMKEEGSLLARMPTLKDGRDPYSIVICLPSIEGFGASGLTAFSILFSKTIWWL